MRKAKTRRPSNKAVRLRESAHRWPCHTPGPTSPGARNAAVRERRRESWRRLVERANMYRSDFTAGKYSGSRNPRIFEKVARSKRNSQPSSRPARGSRALPHSASPPRRRQRFWGTERRTPRRPHAAPITNRRGEDRWTAWPSPRPRVRRIPTPSARPPRGRTGRRRLR